MTKELQHRRGTTSEHSGFRGAPGEITVDTNKFVAIVHDNQTFGGHELVGVAATQTVRNKTIIAGSGTTNPGATLHVTPTSTNIAGIFSGTTSSDMVRITQTGTGNALVVEDETNPDSTPFVVTGIGSVGIGTTNPQTRLQIGGVLGFNGSNVRIGDNTTGASITSGTNNNFIGVGAGYITNTGSSNNFFGVFAGFSNQNGSSNNFLGNGAGYTNTSGTGNNFFGLNAGFSNQSGSSNNFFGVAAGTNNQTGSNNIFLGARNGISASASYKVIIGSGYLSNYFDSPSTTKDYQFAVGIRTDANESKYWLVGDENFNVGIGTTRPTSRLQVVGGDSDFEGVIETVGTAVTYNSGNVMVVEMDVRRATVYTYTMPTGANIGIVSFRNMLAQTGSPSGSTITLLVTQNAAGTGNTTTATGIGTNCTVVGYENGAAVAGISTRGLVGSGTSVTLSSTGRDRDFVSFFIQYTGGTNTTASSYQVYVTKNGSFR